MPVRRRVLRRAAVAAFIACAAMLAPAASRGPAAGAPGYAAQSQAAVVSSVLSNARRPVRPDGLSAGLEPTQPAATASPAATATLAPPPTIVATPRPAPRQAPAAAAVAAAAPPAPPPATGGGWYDAAFAARVRDLINVERARIGLGQLAVEPRLTASATAYAKLLSDTGALSHVGPDGSTLVTRAEAAGFPFTVQEGEVLAWGDGSWPPEGIVRAWMNSPTHREEILSPVYIRAGIGCYFTPANSITVYCTMDLAG